PPFPYTTLFRSDPDDDDEGDRERREREPVLVEGEHDRRRDDRDRGSGDLRAELQPYPRRQLPGRGVAAGEDEVREGVEGGQQRRGVRDGASQCAPEVHTRHGLGGGDDGVHPMIVGRRAVGVYAGSSAAGTASGRARTGATSSSTVIPRSFAVATSRSLSPCGSADACWSGMSSDITGTTTAPSAVRIATTP